MALATRIFDSIAEIDAPVWDACFPGEAECHAYHVACEQARKNALQKGAIGVFDGARLIAAAPTFRIVFRLDTPFPGTLRRVSERLRPLVKGIIDLPIIGLGSPYAERCHLGFAPGVGIDARRAALASLITHFEDHASRRGTGLTALKDPCAANQALYDETFASRGWTRATSLPIALLDLRFRDSEAYLASLSAATRKDIRRKLKKAHQVRVEWRSNIAGLEDEIAALYESTRQRSGLDYGDFETLPDDYFPAVTRALEGRAAVALYWVGVELCAFNLVFIEKDRMIDKFLGVLYPLGSEHNIYAVCWMENVKECLARGIPLLQTGQTAYGLKLRYGSRLEPSFIYFKHRSPLPYAILKTVNRFIKADRLDPDLKAARAFSS